MRSTPYEVALRTQLPLRVGTAAELAAVIQDGEDRALASGGGLAVVTVQHRRWLPGSTLGRLERLADAGFDLIVLGVDVSSVPCPGRAVDLAPTDALALEWGLAIISPELQWAVTGRERTDTTVLHSERRFSWAATTQRTVVGDCIQSCMRRLPLDIPGQRPAGDVGAFSSI